MISPVEGCKRIQSRKLAHYAPAFTFLRYRPPVRLRWPFCYGWGSRPAVFAVDWTSTLYSIYPQRRFSSRSERLRVFERSFQSSSPNESPLYILGVAGNGKSIEANRKIRFPAHGTAQHLIFDFEESHPTFEMGNQKFPLPSSDARWAFVISLLDELYSIIRERKDNRKETVSNFRSIFKANFIGNNQKEFFDIVEVCDFDPVNECWVEMLCEFLVKQANTGDPKAQLPIS